MCENVSKTFSVHSIQRNCTILSDGDFLKEFYYNRNLWLCLKDIDSCPLGSTASLIRQEKCRVCWLWKRYNIIHILWSLSSSKYGVKLRIHISYDYWGMFQVIEAEWYTHLSWPRSIKKNHIWQWKIELESFIVISIYQWLCSTRWWIDISYTRSSTFEALYTGLNR